MTTQPHAYVGTSDIARLAGINRATISNWRRRGVGFPEPVAGNSARPLFDLDEVTTWLESRGIPVGSAPDQPGLADVFDSEVAEVSASVPDLISDDPAASQRISPRRRFEEAFRFEAQLRASLKPHDARRLILELTALKALERRGELEGIVVNHEALEQAAQAAAQLVAADNPALAGTFTDLANYLDEPETARGATTIWQQLDRVDKLDRLARAIGQAIGSDRFGSPQLVSAPLVSKLLAGLVQDTGPSRERAVLGSGSGQVMTRIERLVDGELTGWDVSEEAVEIAAARLAIIGSKARVQVRDLLVDPPLGEKFSAVVSDTPYGVRTPRELHPRLAQLAGAGGGAGGGGGAGSGGAGSGGAGKLARTSEAYWVALTRELLGVEGRGVVVLPLTAWESLPTRESLLAGGSVEAVISLPKHTMPSYEGRSVVVVLRGDPVEAVPVGARHNYLRRAKTTLFVDVESALGAGVGAGAEFAAGTGRGPGHRHERGHRHEHRRLRMNGLDRRSVNAVLELVLNYRENPGEFAEGLIEVPKRHRKRGAGGRGAGGLHGHGPRVRAAVVRTVIGLQESADPRRVVAATPQMSAVAVRDAQRAVGRFARGARRFDRRVDLSAAGEQVVAIQELLAGIDPNELVVPAPTSLRQLDVRTVPLAELKQGGPEHAEPERVELGDILVRPGHVWQRWEFRVVTQRTLDRLQHRVERAGRDRAYKYWGAAVIKTSQADIDPRVVAAVLYDAMVFSFRGGRGGRGGCGERGGQWERLVDIPLPHVGDNPATAQVAQALVALEQIRAQAHKLERRAARAADSLSPLLGTNVPPRTR